MSFFQGTLRSFLFYCHKLYFKSTNPAATPNTLFFNNDKIDICRPPDWEHYGEMGHSRVELTGCNRSEGISGAVLGLTNIAIIRIQTTTALLRDWVWVVRPQGQEVIYKVLRVDLLFGLFKEFEQVGQKDNSDLRKVAALVKERGSKLSHFPWLMSIKPKLGGCRTDRLGLGSSNSQIIFYTHKHKILEKLIGSGLDALTWVFQLTHLKSQPAVCTVNLNTAKWLKPKVEINVYC